MRRTVCLLAGMLLVVLSVGSDSPSEYDGTVTPPDDLSGSWKLVAVGSNTQVAPNVNWFSPPVLTFHNGNRVSFFWCETISGELKADGFQRPGQLDLSWHENEKGDEKFIYRRDGDTLHIGYLPDGNGARPKTFDDDNIRVLTFKRVKK